MQSYTHKMAVVSFVVIDSLRSLHPMYWILHGVVLVPFSSIR